MNIILLKGVLPLKKKIILSKNLGIELDNPRDKDESAYISYFLKERIDFKEDKKLLDYSLVSDTKTILHLNYLDDSLKGLLRHYKDNIYFNKNFLENYNKQKAFDYLIKSWLVVRFDDEGFFGELREEKKEMIKNKERGVFILEGTEIGPKREERTLNFLSIIDLLFLNKLRDRLVKTVIFEEDTPDLHQELLFYTTGLAHGRTIHKELDFFTIADELPKIIKTSAKIDKLSPEQRDKLLFVGETLKNIKDYGRDTKMQFLMLVSIIEFLLTHSPNTSRFNVEDSIRKQFQLKAGIVISKRGGRKLESISQKLKHFYDIRSMIAHGNFAEFKRLMQKFKKEDKNFAFFDYIEEIFDYVGIIVESFLSETDFVESLKKL